MKATARKPARGPRDIVLALGRQAERVVLSVLDRGKGIPPGRAEELFDPFVTDKIGGSGIGLSISRRFVEAAGGSLRLLPREGGGAEARVTLPPAPREGGPRMRVLVADDEKNIRDSVAAYISAEGIEASTAADGAEARALLENEAFDGLILDLRMPRLDGLGLLAWLQESGPRVPVIVISAYGEVQDAVQAMKLGARDYLVKPFDPEELLLRLRRLLAEQTLASQAEAGRRVALAASAGLPWIGAGEKMAQVRALVQKVAPTPSTVLVTGESGTGKEVIARLIHSLSANPDGPFAAINIGGIPDTLLESELFGFEKGAFTGATDRKRGLLELASSGTLFLDEIGDMPPHLQVKLLRVLQERKIQRLGGTQSIPLNARIIAATNRPLEAMLKEGKLPRGPVLQAERDPHRASPAAGKTRGHPRACRFLRGEAEPRDGQEGPGPRPRRAGPAARLRLPRKHPRAGEQDRAGLHPVRAPPDHDARSRGSVHGRGPAAEAGQAEGPGAGADRSGPREERRQQDTGRGRAGHQPQDTAEQAAGDRAPGLTADPRSRKKTWARVRILLY